MTTGRAGGRGRKTPLDAAQWLGLAEEGLTNAQIAAHFDCTVRTLDRYRAAHPEFSAQITAIRAAHVEAAHYGCGTVASYRRGCRCSRCREANRITHYEKRMARRATLGLPPPDPRRGRHRDEIRYSTGSGYHVPDLTERVEQALAAGRSTSWIMDEHGVGYAVVKMIRDRLLGGAA